MAPNRINNIKLGLFVLTGLLLLVIALYFIGRDSNVFGRNFELKVRFENVQGIRPGNNIRYAGIQVGTVKKVKILADTAVEVSMLIEEKMKQYIRKNDLAAISTDGLMGNKLINIIPARDMSPLVDEHDILKVRVVAGTEEMLVTLDHTNNNLLIISENIRQAVERINNNNNTLWKVLEDPTIAGDISASASHIRSATSSANDVIHHLNDIVSRIKAGEGSLGVILTDTSIAQNLSAAVEKIRQVGNNADQLAAGLNSLSTELQTDIRTGKGTIHYLLKDSSLPARMQLSLSHIEAGTAAFNESMEALKHNFLLRGYFRKQEKQKKKSEITAGLAP